MNEVNFKYKTGRGEVEELTVTKEGIKNMKIYLKNMVCQGTRKFVLLEVKKMGLKLKSFESGSIEFRKDLSLDEEHQLEFMLKKYGLEILFDRDNSATVIPAYQGTDHISDYEYMLDSTEAEKLKEVTLAV